MIDVADFISPPGSSSSPGARVAQVIEFFESGAPKIQFAGETALAEKEYPYLRSYVPALEDFVLLLPVADSYVILGAINFQVAPDSFVADTQSQIEEIGAELQAIKSGIVQTNSENSSRFDEIDNELASHESRIDGHDSSLSSQGSTLTSHTNSISSQGGRISQLENAAARHVPTSTNAYEKITNIWMSGTTLKVTANGRTTTFNSP